jgi:hypothetical protein
MKKNKFFRLLMKIIFLRLKQESLRLDKEEGNLDAKGEPMDDIKVATVPIELKPKVNICQLLEYYTLI